MAFGFEKRTSVWLAPVSRVSEASRSPPKSTSDCAAPRENESARSAWGEKVIVASCLAVPVLTPIVPFFRLASPSVTAPRPASHSLTGSKRSASYASFMA